MAGRRLNHGERAGDTDDVPRGLGRRTRPPGWSALVLMLVLVVLALPTAPSGGAPAATDADASTTTTIELDALRDLEVTDDGRLLAAGDDEVVVLDGDGAEIDRVEGIPGAQHIALDGDRAYVVGQSTVVEIDLADLSTTTVFDGTTPLGRAATVADDRLWLVVEGAMHSIDLATGAVIDHGGLWSARELETIPGSPESLLAVPITRNMQRIDVSSGSPVVAATGVLPAGDVAVSSRHQRAVMAQYSSSAVWQIDLDRMLLDGTYYAEVRQGSSVAVGRGPLGASAAASADGKVAVWLEGRPLIALRAQMSSKPILFGVAVAPDDSVVYVAHEGAPGVRLTSIPLAPVLHSAPPPPVPAGTGDAVVVEGTGLGLVTSATVGGTPATTLHASHDRLEIEVPPSLPPGSHQLQLVAGAHTVDVPVVVVPALDASIGGHVRAGDVGIAAATVTVQGGALAAPRQVSTDADGGFAVAGIPAGHGYEVVVDDTSGGRRATRAVAELRPGSAAIVDVDLHQPTVSSDAPSARVPLPETDRNYPKHTLVVEPTTERVFVAGGDRVTVFDRDGHRLATFDEMWGAWTPTLLDGSVYVSLTQARRIVRIDPVALEVTGSWDVGTGLKGIAAGSGSLWFGAAPGHTRLARLDPATGQVDRVATGDTWYAPMPFPIPDDDRRILVMDGASSPSNVTLVGTDAFPPLHLAKTPHGPISSNPDLAASADHDRVWASSGVELQLSTMAPTGVRYPGGSRSAAFSPALGGVLVIDRSVYLVGDTTPTHELQSPAGLRARAIDVAGRRVTTATTEAELVIEDLRPRVLSLTPSAWPAGTATTVTASGVGIDAATEVTIDGVPVAFELTAPGELALQAPALPAGVHDVEVVTPWGTSPAVLLATGQPPVAPGEVVADPGAESATISWSRASVSPPIDGYEVRLRSDSGHVGVCRTSTTTCTIASLRAGELYEVTIRAQSILGWGQWSPPVGVVRPYEPGGGHTDVAPTRIVDSRIGLGSSGPWSAREARSVAVAGRAGVPDDALAVVANVTAVSPTADTHLTVYPGDRERPTASALNLPAGDTRANLAVIPLADDGSISIFNNSGDVHVLVDVTGYFAPLGNEFRTATPTRLLDSRSGIGGWPGPLPGGEERTVALGVAPGVAGDATAVVTNLTAVTPTAPTHVTMWPDGSTRPSVSNVNVPAGDVRPNLAIAGLGDGARVRIRSNSGSVHVLADVTGWFGPGDGDRYFPVTPTRLLDSRRGLGADGPWSTAPRSVDIGGTGPVPEGASAVALNVTAVAPTDPSHLTVWPTDTARPSVSSLNFTPGQAVANLVIAALAPDGTISISNSRGSVHVVADVVGYFQ